MQKVFDYAGNEIKAGQEIVIIKVIDRQDMRAGYVIPSEGKQVWLEEERPDELCWEKSEPIKLDFNLGYWVEGVNHKTYNTVGILKAYMLFPTQIIAINGISDTKEYYDIWKSQLAI